MKKYLPLLILSVVVLAVVAMGAAAPGRHTAAKKLSFSASTAWIGCDSFIGGASYDTLHWTGVHLTSDTFCYHPFFFVTPGTAHPTINVLTLDDTTMIVHTSTLGDTATSGGHLTYYWQVWLKHK